MSGHVSTARNDVLMDDLEDWVHFYRAHRLYTKEDVAVDNSNLVTHLIMEPVFLNKEETTAALGGISLRKLNELMKAGRIIPRVLDGRIMFTPDEVRRFAAECPSWEPG